MPRRIDENFDSGQKSLPADPLIFDLNGDGITTSALNQEIYFDHDSNRFAKSTSWVSQEDGLLVLDRNGNGLIDNGGELFGNHTINE